MKNIKQTYRIRAPLAEVWQALVNPTYIAAWGGEPVKMNDRVGAHFSLWGGSIWGTNIEVSPQKKLVQEWYSKEDNKWEKPSMVTFTLRQENNDVRLDLFHTDIPDNNVKDIEEGWKVYYLGPLKEYLESK
jgi:uncharacterized protein YndB with AHSA1/START domain